ncbi:NAD(P)H-hydrate epimerase, partial [Thioclava sp. BHET1]
MAEVLTTAQMRGVERAAMAMGAVDGLALMERAGEAALAALRARWPELELGARRAVILCGPGNNGGDGFVIARLLTGQGWQVTVYALGDPARLPPDAAANRDRWCALGTVHPLSASPPEEAPDLLVDALFGIGLARPLGQEVTLALARHGAAEGVRRLAVDLPSGLDGDSGAVLGDYAFRADLTVTFHRAKPGHYLGAGPDHCGALAIGDIGLPSDGPAEPEIRLVTGPQCALSKTSGGHKYSHGHA